MYESSSNARGRGVGVAINPNRCSAWPAIAETSLDVACWAQQQSTISKVPRQLAPKIKCMAFRGLAWSFHSLTHHQAGA